MSDTEGGPEPRDEAAGPSDEQPGNTPAADDAVPAPEEASPASEDADPAPEEAPPTKAMPQRGPPRRPSVGGPLPPKPSLVPWVIAGAAGALAAVLLLVFVLPLRSNVSALQADKQQALADVEALTAARDELDAAHDVLEGRVASLELEKAELATEKAIAEQAMEAMRHTQTELEEQLAEEVKKGNVSITESHGELVVDLIDKIVFDSGESELNDRGKEVLRQVGETLKKVPDKVILITGHTDNLPMSEKLIEQFPTNWELSTARATNVVRFLQDEIKVPGKRLGIAGFGEFRPISNNRTKAGRRRNRRIEVRLLPLRGAAK